MAMLLVCGGADAQDCAGAEVRTVEAYQYGRFETRMRSVQGDGVVSSFFLYNLDLDCNWPEENNEIDIEMTGNLDASVQFTTHYPFLFSETQIVQTDFNPHAALHDYAIEWEPDIVRWFIDGELAYSLDSAWIPSLNRPMRILMNLWASDSPPWVGVWDPSVMPAQSAYDYVRYYAYTPATGNAGTDNNFTLVWTDEFSSLDTGRWEATEFGGFTGNYCTFVSANVETTGDGLRLSITEPLQSTSSEVHFAVDVTSVAMAPGDVIFLAGNFNNWCGNCTAMSDSDGDDVWEITLTLPAGNHEYLFVRNGWHDIVGGAPLGSSCDFLPCDEYANYGISVPYGAGHIDTGVHCWGSCDYCAIVDTDGDGVADDQDNCTEKINPLQFDSNGDGYGNRCDADITNDGIVNFGDLAQFKAAFLSNPGTGHWNPNADFTADGAVNFADLAVIKEGFLKPPGPSGIAP